MAEVTFSAAEIASFPQGPPGVPGPPGPPGGSAAGLNVRDFGGLGNDSTDDAAAIQSAINQAAISAGGAAGGQVFVPKGVYRIGAPLVVKNYVRLIGENDNAVRIKAAPSFPAGPLVKMGPSGSGNGDVYGVTLENLRVDCNQAPGSTGIAMSDCNEHCGLFNVEVRNFDVCAIDITASAHITLDRVAASGYAASSALSVIHLHANAGPVWMRSMGNLSSGRTPALPGSAGILVEGTIVQVLGAHFEHVESGVLFATGWGGFVANLNGHSSVTNTLKISSTAHAHTVVGIIIDSAGGPVAILDLTTSTTKPGQVAFYS